MKNILLLLSFITLVASCTKVDYKFATNKQELLSFIEKYKSLKNVVAVKKEIQRSPALESRERLTCDSWAANNTCDCCDADVFIEPAANYNIKMTWFAKNCNGSVSFNNPEGVCGASTPPYKFYFYVIKNSAPYLSGNSDTDRCWGSNFHEWLIQTNGPGTYVINWFVGNTSGQYCALETSNTITL